MKELDPGAIEDFLKRLTIGHLGTVRNGRPYVIPIAYIYENQTIYFATEPGPKTETIDVETEACFEADEYVPELGEYRSVIGYGRPRVVQDAQLRQRMLRRLIGRFERQAAPVVTAKDYPAHTMRDGDEPKELVVVAVPLVELSGREAA